MSTAWKGGSTRRWRQIRAAVLERDQHQCQLKLNGCTNRATHVHHTTSRAANGDNPDHLVASCAHCNQSLGDPTRHDPPATPRTQW